MENKSVKKHPVSAILPIFLPVFLIAAGFLFGRNLSMEELLNHAPEHLLTAAGFLWLLYAAKSIVMVFPVMALYIGGGMLFPVWTALGVSLIGVLIGNTLPYLIGRYSYTPFLKKFLAKHARIRKIYQWTDSHDFLSAYLLRAIGCVPGDVVSLFLGASAMKFWPYTIGSLLGRLPCMVIATLLGSQLNQTISWPFLALLGSLLLLSLSSALLLNRWEKRKSRPIKQLHPVLEEKKQGTGV